MIGSHPQPPCQPLFSLKDVRAAYGEIEVLKGVTLAIGEGEVVCLLGGNASGKTTTIKIMTGLLAPTHGKILWEGASVAGATLRGLLSQGVAVVPEARRLFPSMSVEENLLMGLWSTPDKKTAAEGLEKAYALFPRLRERAHQNAGTLSGGEQQMVALGRALMSRPRLIIMDEPSMGLSPKMVDEVYDTIRFIRDSGVALFIVEQNARKALSLAARGYVLQAGRIVEQGTAAALLKSETIHHAYLGARPI